MSLRPLCRTTAITLVAALSIAAPAGAAIPATPVLKPIGDGRWVQTIDPSTYGGATGKITFNDGGYVGPAGAGPNTFSIGSGFDPKQLSFVQNVEVTAQDWLTSDPATTVYRDDNPLGWGKSPTEAMPDGNMDGQVNLGPHGWTTPPGTKFINMQIDRAGNYFVARKDMQWGFFNTYLYRNAKGTVTPYDTQFNFQPYPLSDAYGFCGSVLTLQPRAMQRQSGQLVFDVAFDVYPNNGGPGRSSTFKLTQVVPGFVMRSYGSYEVDVTTAAGIKQRFVASTTGINFNPITGKLDKAFYQRVSPVGAGVIPAGAWVVNDGNPNTMRVVPEGTPGATWHRNEFAGYAYVLRGDVLRTVVDVPGRNYDDRASWTDYPLADALKRSAGLRLTSVRRSGRVVRVAGTRSATASGPVRVSWALASASGRDVRRGVVATVRGGRFSAKLRLPSRRALAASRELRIVATYAGDATHRAQTVRRSLMA